MNLFKKPFVIFFVFLFLGLFNLTKAEDLMLMMEPYGTNFFVEVTQNLDDTVYYPGDPIIASGVINNTNCSPNPLAMGVRAYNSSEPYNILEVAAGLYIQGSAVFYAPEIPPSSPPYGVVFSIHFLYDCETYNNAEATIEYTVMLPPPEGSVPDVINPTKTSITPTSAILGATVSSLGIPALLFDRGTCITTQAGEIPVQSNCIPEGGTTLGVFSHLRNGLTPNTTYYYNGYATNETGTGYSPRDSFTTPANPPTVNLYKDPDNEKNLIAAGRSTPEGTVPLMVHVNGLTSGSCRIKNNGNETNGISYSNYQLPVPVPISNLTNTNSLKLECTGGEESSPVSILGQSGTLGPNGASCTIDIGEGSCSPLINWATTNPYYPNSVSFTWNGNNYPLTDYSGSTYLTFSGAGVIPNNATSGTGTFVSKNKVDAENNTPGGVVNTLASLSITLNCASGSKWNSTSNTCVPNNVAPIVYAGPDKALTGTTTSATITLATASDTDGPAPLSYLWTVFSKPSGSSPSITNSTTLGPTMSGMSIAGDYIFRLTATEAGASPSSSYDDMKIKKGTVTNYILSVTKAGTGVGTVTSNDTPQGINCGSDCSEPYPSTQTVVLTATPVDNNSYFTGWSGACTGTGTCTLSMSTNRNVIATFTARSNLVANAPTQTTATVGLAKTFTSTITNIGAGSTVNGFSNFFQVCSIPVVNQTIGCTGTVTDKTSTTMSALGPDASNTASTSHTFTSAGTYSVRACADKTSSAGGGVINEGTNEGDNCSTWTNVIVSAAPTVDLSSNVSGGIVGVVNPTLAWTTTNNPTSCVASGDWSGFKNVNGGSESMGVLDTVKTYTYTLICSNAAGFGSSTVTVVVNPANSIPIVINPTAIDIGTDRATLGATVASLGIPANLSARGTCYWTTDPTLAVCLNEGGHSLGSYSHVRTGLTPNTTYHYRGFATNPTGTGSTYTASFTTLGFPLPVVVTRDPVINITATTATGGGTVISNGGSPVTVSGCVWGTSENPTTTNNMGITTDGWAMGGPWPCEMSGLTANTLYHVRAYATNVSGTAYGADVSFKTLAPEGMSGTLTGPDCVIATGASSCNTTLTWSINNTEAIPSAITASGMTDISLNTPIIGNDYSGTQTVVVPYSNRTFYLYNNAKSLVPSIEYPNGSGVTINANCVTGTTWNGTVCSPIVGPWANISATDCTIPLEGSTCTSTLNWSTGNLTDTPEVTRNNPNGTHVSYAPSGTNISNVVNHGNSTFYVYHLGTELASAPMNASCESGTDWEDGKCVASTNPINGVCGATAHICGIGSSINWTEDGNFWYWDCEGLNGGETANCKESKIGGGGGAMTVDLSATRSIIFKGKSSELVWTSTGATTCTGEGEGFETNGATSGSDLVTPLTTTTYTITCTDGGSLAEAEDTAKVIVINPKIIEN